MLTVTIMNRHCVAMAEIAELVVTGAGACTDGRALRLIVTLHSWVRVDEVKHTGGKVLKRTLHDPPRGLNGATVPVGT